MAWVAETTGRALDAARQALRKNRRPAVRIALQTAVAVAVTYAAGSWLRLDEMSWAVISALFTIGVSADRSLTNAAGRLAGAVLGVVLGLGAQLVPDAAALVGLVAATTLANAVAATFPALRYAAVTAAVLALGANDAVTHSMDLVAAIGIGSAIGAATTLVVWPSFGRRRTDAAVRAALVDCQRLLGQIEAGIETDEHVERDRINASFLGHLEAARSRLAETRFRPTLPSGVPLRAAVEAVERLWHALMVLDRAVTDERHALGPEVQARLREGLDGVRAAAGRHLERILDGMEGRRPEAPEGDGIGAAVEAARRRIDAALREASAEGGEVRALHALSFALDETASQLGALRELVPRSQAS